MEDLRIGYWGCWLQSQGRRSRLAVSKTKALRFASEPAIIILRLDDVTASANEFMSFSTAVDSVQQ
jgi:hypothetical protein